MKSKAFVIKSDVEYVYVPEDSRERFLTSPLPSIHYLLDHGILLAGISNLKSGYRVDRNRFKNHLIQYTIGGSGSLRIAGGKVSKLKKGDVFTAPWHSEYSYETDSSWDILWIHLQTESKWDSQIGPSPRVRRASWAGELERQMEGYIGEVNRRRTDSAALLHSYADLIVHYLQRELGKNNTPGVDLERVWNEVQHHIARKWTVTELAALTGMSRSRFHRIVSEQTGSPPMQVVHTMRMERASTMLLYTDYTLESIAEAVGYDDQFAFSKAFKRYAGTSPGRFREK